MEQEGKISVVIPVYNGEQYIEAAVNSVLKSDYRNIEVLIVDDGSTDGSYAVCERLRQTDDRIVIYRKDNGGVVSARNYGVSMAAGAYLCFCDQDDILDRTCYAKQVGRMESDQSDICICGVGRYTEGRISVFEQSADACYEGEEILEQLLYPILFNGFDVPVKMGERRHYTQIWPCMFRMSFWRRYDFRFRSYVSFEDDMLVKVQALANAGRVSTLSMTGYYWRTNLASESYTHAYIEKIAAKQQACYEDLYTSLADRIRDKKILEWFKQVTYCRQYLEAVHNIARSETEKSSRIISDYYEDNIYSRQFEECIAAAGYVNKRMVKPRILLGILAKRQTMLSYCAEKILDGIQKMTLHSQVLTKMERMTKGIGTQVIRKRGSYMQRAVKKKVLYIMGIDWEWIYQRPQIIAAYLSRDYDVTAAYPVKIWNRGAIRNTEEKPPAIHKLKLWTLPFQRKSRLIGSVADRCQRIRLKNYQEYDYIYISYPTAVEYIPMDYRGLLIYDCMDDHEQMCPNEIMRRKVARDEEILLQRSDVVIVSSQNLWQKKAKICNKKISLVRNGTCLAKICEVKTAVIKKQYLIGYIGTIAEWFDHELLMKSTQKQKNLEYHLIGPCDPLHQKENSKIIYDGVIEHAKLPFHVKDYDCMIMPFIVNEIVKAVDPVKLYEYIALGKCIISVYYEELQHFEAYVYFYRTGKEYENLIRTLTEQGFPPKYNQKQQIEFLEQNNWQERYQTIRQLMEQMSSYSIQSEIGVPGGKDSG
ncbi:MAG: glycosyltransferase [Lachnospiraceae bacterium]|nr:glycosyltransferase [Lachnospiraceae bacterium]